MASREEWTSGLGVLVNGGTILTGNASYLSAGSLTWLPWFVTAQAAWATGTSYTACSDVQGGAMTTASSVTYVCTTAGSGTSTVNPATGTGGTTTIGAFTSLMSDGYRWLAMGNATADFTSLANTYQAVSQIVIDNRPSQGAGDPYIQIGMSLVTSGSGAAGDYITHLLQPLNPDGSTYADGLGGGSNPSAPQVSQGNLYYPAGKSSPVVGRLTLPLFAEKCRGALINVSGNALSAPSAAPVSSGVVSDRRIHPERLSGACRDRQHHHPAAVWDHQSDAGTDIPGRNRLDASAGARARRLHSAGVSFIQRPDGDSATADGDGREGPPEYARRAGAEPDQHVKRHLCVSPGLFTGYKRRNAFLVWPVAEYRYAAYKYVYWRY